ncbi:DUF3991 and TOPRIM domain-containing protein [Lactiplantibacillus plantarum]|uniref:DUF3991 and TOPRIM domain-containing protein n=1 Tax=Lactiplantibacillus plantarum TaxID=1590 RepID=UPI0024466693|nr:DUF3991 and TOPRIM domain-containing protein [Lactiplantibacillus plantarum]MDG6764826.1 DUF3991 and TOPRIM domain-containing protein [Lactiplantibacillus plantarum]MDH2715653.1 DUF3991 and TOPRIM domain-containing protein [Lactiplantibacillus plantarum]MDH7467531.1 DUF3991 and TOPRIM domain-containing protein [Lactiplantibacillus plantarum]MDN3215399.1 DUF3991 and TOPRIM domain-containing protein [Lactiplantibacillus plantarum]MDN3218464.1 DUF3991 and TOPRIM domain-containing protein [Lact
MALQLADYVSYAGLPFKHEGRYLRSQEHDSLIIDTRKNYFIWNSQGLAGNLSQFIKAYYGVSDREIHFRLKAFTKTNPHQKAAVKADYSTKSAVGPVAPLDAAGMAYLTQYRHFDPRLITFAAEQGLLGSDGYHNVIFNWFDAAGTLVGQDVQGTVINRHRYPKHGSLKQIKTGSKPHYGFNVRFRGPFKHLYVFESPLDLLSYWQMYAQELSGSQLLSLSGASAKIQTINDYLVTQPAFPAYLHLAPDNDVAGRALIEKFQHMRLVKSHQPCQSLVEWSDFKDWNAQLQTVKTKPYTKVTFDMRTFDQFQLFNKLRECLS